MKSQPQSPQTKRKLDRGFVFSGLVAVVCILVCLWKIIGAWTQMQ